MKNYKVLLITGIANPNPLVDYLTSYKIKFEHLKYSDHYNFTKTDIQEIINKRANLKSKNNIVLTTEKDYVRIFDKIKNLHFISINTVFINHKIDFDNIIKKYVEQGSRDS